MHQILSNNDSDVHRIVRYFEVDSSKLAADLTKALDRLPRGATAISDLSEHIESAVERAWVYGTLKYGDAQVRSGYIMVCLLYTSRCV